MPIVDLSPDADRDLLCKRLAAVTVDRQGSMLIPILRRTGLAAWAVQSRRFTLKPSVTVLLSVWHQRPRVKRQRAGRPVGGHPQGLIPKARLKWDNSR
jgi:hypothetical protein